MTHASKGRAPLPVVSIVTPMLDPGPRLRHCLDSVEAQSYDGPIEHIVVDGGSTDGSLELLSSRTVTWISEPDRGQSDAINKGFDMASGEVLTWLNADDVLHRDAVARAVAALGASPEAGWVYGDLDIERDGRHERLRPPHPPEPDHFSDGCPIPGVGTFVTRWALDRVGPLDVSLHLAMDLDLWMRLLQAGIEATYVPETQATFVLHEGSKTAQPGLDRRYREQVAVFAKVGELELARRALGRWEWWRVRRDVERLVDEGRPSAARRIARSALGGTDLRSRKRLGLLLLTVVPGLGTRVMRRLGHGIDG